MGGVAVALRIFKIGVSGASSALASPLQSRRQEEGPQQACQGQVDQTGGMLFATMRHTGVACHWWQLTAADASPATAHPETHTRFRRACITHVALLAAVCQDALLADVARKCNFNWKEVARHFRDRSDVQCMTRHQKVAVTAVVKGPWTREVRPCWPSSACLADSSFASRVLQAQRRLVAVCSLTAC